MDKPDGFSLRRRTRASHLEYMIRQKALVLFGGPIVSDANEPIGSLMILDLDSRAEVDSFLAAEPYNISGLFESVFVRSFRQMVPENRPGLLDEELQRERAMLAQA
jgi:uncharacterized protein YciI